MQNMSPSKDLEQVLHIAVDIFGGNESKLHEFMNTPLSPFDFKTPHELVLGGRADALVRYLESLKAGFLG